MSRIVSLQAENVKRLHAVHITPTGNLVVIGGKNAQGKSSVLDAIAMAIGGANEIPPMPVRRGEKKASVVLDLGDIVIRRTFTAHEGGDATSSLVVENKDKMRANAPQAILEKLTGKVTFDPLAFVHMEPAKQAATLKRLVGLDFSALDSKRAQLYAERTLVNRDAQQARARLAGMPKHADAPVEETNAAEILAERDAATQHNAQKGRLDAAVMAARSEFNSLHVAAGRIRADIEETERRLAKLRGELAEYEAKRLPDAQAELTRATQAASAFKPTDLAPINARLAAVESTNRKVRENAAHDTAERTLQQTESKSEALTSQIAEIDKQKDEQLAAVKFPVAGLSFDTSGGVVFGGIPFDQASAAEKLRASVAIAAAMNPKLRVMLVRDASLLDEDGLAQLERLADEFDLQIWCEKVGKGAECQVIIEDGTVLPIAQATEQAAKRAANAEADMFTGRDGEKARAA